MTKREFDHEKSPREKFNEMLVDANPLARKGKVVVDKKDLRKAFVEAFPAIFRANVPKMNLVLLFSNKRLFDEIVKNHLSNYDDLALYMYSDGDSVGRLFDQVGFDALSLIDDAERMKRRLGFHGTGKQKEPPKKSPDINQSQETTRVAGTKGKQKFTQSQINMAKSNTTQTTQEQ